MEDIDAAIEQTIEALKVAGLYAYELGGGIINVHSEQVTTDGSDDSSSYLFTVTVTVTP